MRKTHKEMCQNDEVVTRRIISIDPITEEYTEMRDNTRKYLYQQWDKNLGRTYIPKYKRKGSK